MELSAVDLAMFGTAAAVIMAYHAWFFVSTTIRPDREAAEAARRRAQSELDTALAEGRAVAMEDYRQARQLRDGSGGDGGRGGEGEG